MSAVIIITDHPDLERIHRGVFALPANDNISPQAAIRQAAELEGWVAKFAHRPELAALVYAMAAKALHIRQQYRLKVVS